MRTRGPDGQLVRLGDVEAPDSRRAREAARQRWPDVPILAVQSHASLAVAAEEERAAEHEARGLLTLAEAAQLAGTGVKQLYRAVEAGELPSRHVVVSGGLRIDRRALRRWMVAAPSGGPIGDGEGDDDGEIEGDEGRTPLQPAGDPGATPLRRTPPGGRTPTAEGCPRAGHPSLDPQA